MNDSLPDAVAWPRLAGDRVLLRPGTDADVRVLHEILTEESVAQWWGEPQSLAAIRADFRGEQGDQLLVIELDGAVVGGIQYSEEDEPMYRHAGIDIFLSSRARGRGVGTEAVSLLARFLIEERDHHRLVIDPAATNERAIRCYRRVGFRPVGIMRQYERGPDGTFHDGLLMDLLAAEFTPDTPMISGKSVR
jgi:aminoglycoside 6'-N-acetyltransferase